MTRTAIYARKSTKQDRAEDEKSVAEQERTCRAFISKSGWTPPTDAHVYVDDAKSGALFTAQGRPQFFKEASGRSSDHPFD